MTPCRFASFCLLLLAAWFRHSVLTSGRNTRHPGSWLLRITQTERYAPTVVRTKRKGYLGSAIEPAEFVVRFFLNCLASIKWFYDFRFWQNFPVVDTLQRCQLFTFLILLNCNKKYCCGQFVLLADPNRIEISICFSKCANKHICHLAYFILGYFRTNWQAQNFLTHLFGHWKALSIVLRLIHGLFM